MLNLKDVFDYYYKKEDILYFLELIEGIYGNQLTIKELVQEIEKTY